MILLVDNYDSFVFNLARYLEELGHETVVVRNDALTVDGIAARKPRAIVISPGPCTPNEAGVSLDVFRKLSADVPILGVCLGHQALAAAFGGKVVRAPEPVHGRTSLILHNHKGLFADLPSPFRATRYHSLIAEEQTLPTELEITARTPDGLIMGLAHRSRPCFGVQFHPESVLTEHGHRLLANFLRHAGLSVTATPPGDWQPSPPSGAELPPLPYPVPWT
jgi:anthranilate synthase/aminodeoxychorismate synthase-like glutamine amidotransferase